MGNKYYTDESELALIKREWQKVKYELQTLRNEQSAYWKHIKVVRFLWMLPGSNDVEFFGEAIVKVSNLQDDDNGVRTETSDVQIITCFRREPIGEGKALTTSWNPYGRDYDRLLTDALQEAALNAFYNNHASEITFPGEIWG